MSYSCRPTPGNTNSIECDTDYSIVLVNAEKEVGKKIVPLVSEGLECGALYIGRERASHSKPLSGCVD